jgi:hypothetical protein
MSSQNLKRKCECNTKDAIELKVEKSKILLEHEDELLQQEVCHKQDMSRLRKHYTKAKLRQSTKKAKHSS